MEKTYEVVFRNGRSKFFPPVEVQAVSRSQAKSRGAKRLEELGLIYEGNWFWYAWDRCYSARIKRPENPSV